MNQREENDFLEDQAFSPSYGLVAPPPPSPVSKQYKLDRRQTGRLRKRDNLLTGEGEGWGRSQIMWRRESLVFYKSFTTSWPISFLANGTLLLVGKYFSFVVFIRNGITINHALVNNIRYEKNGKSAKYNILKIAFWCGTNIWIFKYTGERMFSK